MIKPLPVTIANVVYVVNGCISYAKAISLFLTRSIIESSISGRATNGAVCARKEGTVQQEDVMETERRQLTF
jgi:hypothetical protein